MTSLNLLRTFALAASLGAAATQSTPLKDLERELSDVQKYYNGTCWFDQEGILTFSRDSLRWVEWCLVFFPPDDPSDHYLVLLDRKNKPFELRVFNEPSRTQEIRWRRDWTGRRPQ